MSDLFSAARLDAAPPLMVMPAHVTPPAQEVLDLPDADMLVVQRALGASGLCFGMNQSAARVADAVVKTELGQLSARQRNAAIRIAYRFRRQMPRNVQEILKQFAPCFFRVRR
jgi:hypothetical protein